MSEQKTNDMSQHFYRASAADFMKIPGSPIGYWVSNSIRNVFVDSKKIVGNIANPNQALVTGNTELYIRKWYEPSFSSVGIGLTREEAKLSMRRWFPYNKGGDYRNWFGNFEHVLDWENDGHKLQTTLHPSGKRIWAHNFVLNSIFLEAIVWSKITSGKPCFRYSPDGFLYDDASGVCSFNSNKKEILLGLLCSKVNLYIQKIINPTLNIQPENIRSIPLPPKYDGNICNIVSKLITNAKTDWNSQETSWEFTYLSLLAKNIKHPTINISYINIRSSWLKLTQEMQRLEEENNRIFIDAYDLQDELTPEVPLKEITLTCNPHYRYGGDLTEQEREDRLQSDTIAELVSYAIGCMMGRYSLDREGLVYAYANNEGFADLVAEGAYSTFAADEDGIIPFTDQEWFKDDATNLFRDFIRTAWDEEHLQENLDFVAESLCLYAIKPRKNESSLEVIRRYLSTQFYKDHLKTYKKRPIYWLFSSGKQKAFECLVYLHRYNEGTLARMRTEYVSPLLGKYDAYAEQLDKQIDNASSTAEANRLKKELATLQKKQVELREFDDKLKHFADMRISIDLDDGVKVNYGKFGDLLANVKDITGSAPVL